MSWSKLSHDEQRQFARLCTARRNACILWLKHRQMDHRKSILLVGDQPGPRAPQTDDHHQTPFYSKEGSGGWLNEQLVKAALTEDRLFWINSATWDGRPGCTRALQLSWTAVIALGNNAAKWLTQHGIPHIKVQHPQAHKRFNAGLEYPLIPILHDLHSGSS